MRLLLFGLVFKKTLLLTGLTREEALVLPQAVLFLPGLCPALIEQRKPERQHGIDVFRFPMHAWTFEPSLHHELVATLDTSRPNWPALLLVRQIVHQVAPLL